MPSLHPSIHLASWASQRTNDGLFDSKSLQQQNAILPCPFEPLPPPSPPPTPGQSLNTIVHSLPNSRPWKNPSSSSPEWFPSCKTVLQKTPMLCCCSCFVPPFIHVPSDPHRIKAGQKEKKRKGKCKCKRRRQKPI